jgi:hypothetical protein
MKERNIVRSIPGPKGKAKYISLPLETWELFFTEEIISDICKCTNQEIDRKNIKYSSNPSWCKPATIAEIRGLICILYLCAAKKDNHMDAQVL